MTIQQLCTFRVDDLFMGIPASYVQEVLVHQQTTRLPLAHEIVRGLINLRGEIVTTICMRRRMGMDPLPEGELPMNIVIQIEDESVSLLVDMIGDVIDVTSDSFELPPDTIAPDVRNVIVGVYKLDRELLLALDPKRAIEIPATEPATAMTLKS